MQMMYSPSLEVSAQRQSLVPVLGVWHPMKVAFERIHDVFLPFFWAPAMHALAPRSPIFPKTKKLQKLISFFLQVMHSYPSFQTKLDNALNRNQLNTNQRNILLNLKDIFEYYIPSVSFFATDCFFTHTHYPRSRVNNITSITKWTCIPRSRAFTHSQRQLLIHFDCLVFTRFLNSVLV